MSSGSTFYFLQTTVEPVKASEDLIKEALETVNKYREEKLTELPPYTFIKNKLIAGPEHVLWNVVVEDSFTSSFTVLKDYWNMNPYKDDSAYKEIDSHTASQLYQTVSYILGNKWSEQVEELLDNPFIQVFKDESYFMTKKEREGECLYMFTDLKALHKLLGAYLYLESSDVCDPWHACPSKFKLLYSAW